MLVERKRMGAEFLAPTIEESRTDDLVLVDYGGPDNIIATVTLNRPQIFNAMNTSSWIALADTFRGLTRDGSVRAVILEGAGYRNKHNFSQGADLFELCDVAEELQKLSPDERRIQGENVGMAYFDLIHSALDAIEEFPFDVIAKGRGAQMGAGLEIALACDDRIGDAKSLKTGIPAAEKDIMLPPDDIARFISTIGIAHTSEMLSTGAFYDAQASARLLVVNRLVEPEEIDEVVWNLALEKTKQAPEAVRARKAGLLYFKRNLEPREEDIVPEIHYGWAGSDNFYNALRAYKNKQQFVFGLMEPRNYRPYR